MHFLRSVLLAAAVSAVALADDASTDARSQEPSADHWAWRPLDATVPPASVASTFGRTPVDSFVAAKWAEQDLAPAPAASPRILLRRVYLDLIGMPPTPAEQADFLKDPSDEAYARVVDDLLGRPQYGERWGRHWLDVVRYAETKGYERDEYKKFVWRYRDYVIDAFNEDLPYDQFIMEQLAGDELDNVSVRTQIATTFLSLGTFDTIAADQDVARYDTLDDMVATTSMAFLGQTLQCARCHDHKFEPFSQVDYYRMLAAFESLDVTKKERQLGTEEDLERFREAEARFLEDDLEPKLESEIQAWLPILKRIAEEETPSDKQPTLDAKHVALAIEAIETESGQRSGEHKKMLAKERNKVRQFVHHRAAESEREELRRLEADVAQAEDRRPEPTMGWVYPDRSNPAPTRLRVRGDVHQLGEEVPFGLPTVLAHSDLPEPKPTASSPGRRRALAEWITGPGAPLAARVMANRIWQYHFGQGLVSEANNLGIAGGPPSHPELLDWLAGQLIEDGWRMKPLHRSIVLSSIYRLSATHPDAESDPDNQFFARWPTHRLEAEAIRDSILAISGELNLKQAGPPVYPPFEKQVVGASSRSDWGDSPPEEAVRRSIYVFAKRSIPLPELAVLGSPDSSVSCDKRTVSTTAVQSLLLLNGRFATEQATLLANRLRNEAGDDRCAQIDRAFDLVLCRPPRESERADAHSFLEAAETKDDPNAPDPLASLCLVLLNTNEFVYRN